MNYGSLASARTPAHIIFLIDISGSMTYPFFGQPRISVVSQALNEVLFQLVDMSTKFVNNQPMIRPRYNVAIIGYNETIEDPYGGFLSIDRLAEVGVPIFSPQGETNAYLGFQAVESLLDSILRTLPPESPAPFVCHLTDGEYNQGSSPLVLAERIKAKVTPDGPVLLENIFVHDQILRNPVYEIEQWQGARSESDMANRYAVELFRMSSSIPPKYLETIRYWGFNSLQSDAKLLFPGNNPDLIKTALVTAGSSGGMPGQRVRE